MIEYIVYLTTNSNISNSKCHILIDYTSHESFINLDQRKNGYGYMLYQGQLNYSGLK